MPSRIHYAKQGDAAKNEYDVWVIEDGRDHNKSLTAVSNSIL